MHFMYLFSLCCFAFLLMVRLSLFLVQEVGRDRRQVDCYIPWSVKYCTHLFCYRNAEFSCCSCVWCMGSYVMCTGEYCWFFLHAQHRPSLSLYSHHFGRHDVPTYCVLFLFLHCSHSFSFFFLSHSFSSGCSGGLLWLRGPLLAEAQPPRQRLHI